MRKARGRICIREATPVQVAAVCYRHEAGSPRFLLVRTSSGRWTFPKGRQEDGLSHAEVAALEAFEEGGVEGEVHPRPVGKYLHRKESLRGESKEVTVLAFTLEVKKSSLPAESHRTPRWFSAAEAKRRLANRRSEKYLRGMERVFDSALQRIARKHSHQ
jgi:8-oxo-dGTP pyrophosphatase MutT (NUDIX family)